MQKETRNDLLLKENLEKSGICPKCKTECADNQQYCHRCGKNLNSKNNSMHSKVIIGISVSILFLIVIFIAVFGVIYVFPYMFVTVDDLMMQGNYEEAYMKSDNEKERVIIESTIAYLSYESSRMLRNPDSFILQEVYYHDGEVEGLNSQKQIVLYISGTNGYGAVTSNYWIWEFNSKTKQWEYVWTLGTIHSFENYKQGKILDEKYYKVVNKIINQDNIKNCDSMIENINNHFKNDKIKEVKMINT